MAPAPTGPVLERIAELFPAEGRAEVAELLSRYGAEPHEREPERVQLAILTLSRGDKSEVARLLEVARKDYRDVLWWAEEP